ncbi:MAG TPA: trypsin-like peptidase domain-containing protein [Candidatus Paceibacterota bacterium]
MSSQMRHLSGDLLVLAVLIGALVFLVRQNALQSPPPDAVATTTSQVSASAAVTAPTNTPPAATSSPPSVSAEPLPPDSKNAQQQSQDIASSVEGPPQASRIENPYTTPALAPAEVSAGARAALVNIFCYSGAGGGLRPISGSGVLIDSRGVILTNAHVAQYVLLSESPQMDLDCYVRNGAPAVAHWVPRVLYIPAIWVRAHAADITADRPLGTGEHDYALLSIAASVDDSPLPAFPILAPDTREAIAFVGDQALVSSYPAEFAGASASLNLYPASTFTTIKEFLTFSSGTVDVISVGSVIQAQTGSSGGAVVNDWGRLVGIITTTSNGATTAERELRGITLSYIDRDLVAQTGAGLAVMLAGDTAARTDEFSITQAPLLMQLFLKQLIK